MHGLQAFESQLSGENVACKKIPALIAGFTGQIIDFPTDFWHLVRGFQDVQLPCLITRGYWFVGSGDSRSSSSLWSCSHNTGFCWSYAKEVLCIVLFHKASLVTLVLSGAVLFSVAMNKEVYVSIDHCQSARYPAKNDKFFAVERRYSHTKRLVRISLYPCKIELD